MFKNRALIWGEINIEHISSFNNKYIPNGVPDMISTPDVANNPNNPFVKGIQRQIIGNYLWGITGSKCWNTWNAFNTDKGSVLMKTASRWYLHTETGGIHCGLFPDKLYLNFGGSEALFYVLRSPVLSTDFKWPSCWMIAILEVLCYFSVSLYFELFVLSIL